MRITVKRLEREGACRSQISEFKRRFPVRRYPNGVTVTEERCVRVAHLFNWGWAARHFLIGAARRRYDRAAAAAECACVMDRSLERLIKRDLALAQAFAAAATIKRAKKPVAKRRHK